MTITEPSTAEHVEAATIPAPPALDLAEQLRAAGAAGTAVILTPGQAAELGDLAAFAGFARDQLYPTWYGLQPLVARVKSIGPELEAAGPMALLGLLRG